MHNDTFSKPTCQNKWPITWQFWSKWLNLTRFSSVFRQKIIEQNSDHKQKPVCNRSDSPNQACVRLKHFQTLHGEITDLQYDNLSQIFQHWNIISVSEYLSQKNNKKKRKRNRIWTKSSLFIKKFSAGLSKVHFTCREEQYAKRNLKETKPFWTLSGFYGAGLSMVYSRYGRSVLGKLTSR